MAWLPIPSPPTPVPPRRRFVTLPLSAAGFPLLFQGAGLRLRSAGSSGSKVVSSLSPTDWVPVSCCFPPRLAATQLQSTSRPESVCLRRILTFHLLLLGSCTLTGARAASFQLAILPERLSSRVGAVPTWPPFRGSVHPHCLPSGGGTPVWVPRSGPTPPWPLSPCCPFCVSTLEGLGAWMDRMHRMGQGSVTRRRGGRGGRI